MPDYENTIFDVEKFTRVIEKMRTRADAVNINLHEALYFVHRHGPVYYEKELPASSRFKPLFSQMEEDVVNIASHYVDMEVDYEKANYTTFPLMLVRNRLMDYCPDLGILPDGEIVFNDSTKQLVDRFLGACDMAMDMCHTVYLQTIPWHAWGTQTASKNEDVVTVNESSGAADLPKDYRLDDDHPTTMRFANNTGFPADVNGYLVCKTDSEDEMNNTEVHRTYSCEPEVAGVHYHSDNPPLDVTKGIVFSKAYVYRCREPRPPDGPTGDCVGYNYIAEESESFEYATTRMQIGEPASEYKNGDERYFTKNSLYEEDREAGTYTLTRVKWNRGVDSGGNKHDEQIEEVDVRPIDHHYDGPRYYRETNRAFDGDVSITVCRLAPHETEDVDLKNKLGVPVAPSDAASYVNSSEFGTRELYVAGFYKHDGDFEDTSGQNDYESQITGIPQPSDPKTWIDYTDTVSVSAETTDLFDCDIILSIHYDF